MINSMLRDREAYTTDMSYSTVGAHPIKVDGCEITFDPSIPLRLDRTENPGLYIGNGKGAGQCRAVVKTEGNVVTIESPFAVDPDENSELNYGGTIRTNFYLVNNYVNNAGHIQFYVDQCLSVFDGNHIDHAAGLLVFSERSIAKNLADNAEEIGQLNRFNRMSMHFISILNNNCVGGNHFHFFGTPVPDGCEYGKSDGWSGYTLVGGWVRGEGISCRGVHYKNNVLADNAMLKLTAQGSKAVVDVSNVGTAENFIFENNTVHDSEYGISIECFTKAAYIRNNNITEDVTTPLTILFDKDDESKILIED